MDRVQRQDRPLVYGYLCMEEANEAQIARWRQEIAAFCTTCGYLLGSIFIDRGVSVGSFARDGFIELLAALRLPEAFGVVVPSLAHLSTETFVQQALVHMVQLTNSQLLVSTRTNGSNPEISLSDGPGAES